MRAKTSPKKSPAKKEVKENTFPVVAIGASAGGLEAIMELLKHLPSVTGMAFIYVQHLSPDHKSMLTEILSKKTKMIVQEIDDMDKIKPDNVFVIPYNKGIEVTDGHIKLIPRSETSAAISIDILFSSLAEAQKERVIGIILSGSASDGTIGMKAIKQNGGLTFAQDDTAKFTSMPHSAIAAGVVDFILSPKEIALEIARLSKHPLIKAVGVKNGEEDLIDNGNPDLKIILNQLHKTIGVDFSAYKMNTIKRRIIRRMLLYKITNLKEYAKLLTNKNEEINILYQDLLINVTSFFRDTATHEYLKENLFPKLLKRKKTGEALRIWVPACATGEEAYSIAMMLLEIQGSKNTAIPVQIFATDLSQQAIAKARIGVYTKHDIKAISPKRIQRFFTKENGSFRVTNAVRDMCVFAPHNILCDPPFSRLDFISCCNLFIYLDTAAQKKAVNTFHYALKSDGFLMLGKSENISQSTSLFTSVNKKYKIFSRKINRNVQLLPELKSRFAQQTIAEKNVPLIKRNKTQQNIAVNHQGLDNAIDAVLVSEFMPASVVINYQMEIVQFRGTTNLFLSHPKGKATFNILKMTRPEIAFELRNSISKVIKTKQRIRKSGIELKTNTEVKIISFEIVPLKIESDEPLLLILFTEQEQTEIYSQQATSGKNNSLAKDRRIKKLEQELAAAHADALAISQEQEAFTEELQSSNEEVVSSNEELQTVNEELETSKEEIESANEELTTTNQELQTRNDLLNESYEYSKAIVSTMHEPMLVLGKDLRVKSANKSFYQQFAATEAETEGVMVYELGNKQWDIPKLRELLETIIPKNSHFYDFEVEHTFENIGKKIMLLNASRIIQKAHREQLILLSIADHTEVRNIALQTSLKEKEALELQIETQTILVKLRTELEGNVRRLFMEAPALICVLRGPQHVYELANEMYLQLVGKRNILGKSIREILPELEGQGFFNILDKIYSTGEPYSGTELLSQLDKGNGKLEDAYFNFVYQPSHNSEGEIDGIFVHGVEVTEQVLARKKIEESEFRYHNMIYTSTSLIAIFKGEDMIIDIANDAVLESWGKGKDVIGKSIYLVLPEIVEQGFDKLLLGTYKTGEPFYAYEQPVTLNKNGKQELMHYTYIYQAQHNANGKIEGVAVIAREVTAQVELSKELKESEKQQSFLLKLSDALRPLDNPMDIEEAATKIAMDFMDADWCHYCIIEEDNLIIRRDSVRGDLPSVVGEYHIRNFALFKTILDAGRPYVVDDVHTTDILDEELKQLCQQMQNISFINVPVIKNGKPVGLLSIVQSKPRKWTKLEVQLTIETAERTWAAVERAKAEEALRNSEEKYRSLFTSMDQGFALCELVRNKEGKGIDFCVLEVNPTYEKQAGVSMEMVVGKTILQVFPGLDKWWIDTYAEVVDSQRPAVFEHYFEITHRWFAIKAYPGEKERFAVLFNDITERKQAEEKIKESETQLRLLSNVLEQKVRQRTTQLEEKNIELQIMNKELEAFTYISSHDLQEPLRKIQTFAKRLLENENQNLSDTGKDYFHRMQQAASRMQTLIQDLLAFSRLTTSERKFEVIQLSDIFKEVKAELRETIKKKNATIETGEMCEIKVIPFQFKQLIQNLFSNALKFSKPGEPLHITIKCKKIPAGSLSILSGKPTHHIIFSDNGIGFEKHFSEQIFELFQKLHDKSEYPGTGIGLAIVKKIVENHNGIITAASELGKGVRFDIYIPA